LYKHLRAGKITNGEIKDMEKLMSHSAKIRFTSNPHYQEMMEEINFMNKAACEIFD
jgi:hypothetical protein